MSKLNDFHRPSICCSFTEECEDVLSNFNDKMSEMQARVKELERKLADAPAERERELKKAEADLNRVRVVAEKAVQAAAAKREVGLVSSSLKFGRPSSTS